VLSEPLLSDKQLICDPSRHASLHEYHLGSIGQVRVDPSLVVTTAWRWHTFLSGVPSLYFPGQHHHLVTYSPHRQAFNAYGRWLQLKHHSGCQHSIVCDDPGDLPTGEESNVTTRKSTQFGAPRTSIRDPRLARVLERHNTRDAILPWLSVIEHATAS